MGLGLQDVHKVTRDLKLGHYSQEREEEGDVWEEVASLHTHGRGTRHKHQRSNPLHQHNNFTWPTCVTACVHVRQKK